MHYDLQPYNFARVFVIGDVEVEVDSLPAFQDFRCVPENKTLPVSAFTPCLSARKPGQGEGPNCKSRRRRGREEEEEERIKKGYE